MVKKKINKQKRKQRERSVLVCQNCVMCIKSENLMRNINHGMFMFECEWYVCVWVGGCVSISIHFIFTFFVHSIYSPYMVSMSESWRLKLTQYIALHEHI